MAKDATEKPVSSGNSDSNSPPTSDQQRVPPLRIVLNVAGNQKSSSASSSSNPQDIKREKTNDSKVEHPNKPGSKVRIKLGTGKPNNRGCSSVEAPNESQKNSRSSKDQDSSSKDDSAIVYSHLRRITRRSQRTVQAINNEDEESMTSMTSIDENQNSNSNNNSGVNNSDSNGGSLDSASVTSTQTSTINNNITAPANGGSTNPEGPRRKRKKGETSESSVIDYESTFNFQSYRISVQNSFELFKNIRKHVDNKLKTLSNVHPKAPHGFRDYMLIKGAYLLDGNKLGNGTNLFMNEDGGLNPAPMGKYHVLRSSRVNYTVPNRAKVPLGLPVNSPLYNLFIEQEKERYRMRMQHIKEREKLTLAAEQEIMRVYNQAALAALNQEEPFSACTMLKHQEIYNYLDSEGLAILASEDARLDQVKSSEGVRTRRRQHEQITSPGRKTSNSSEPPPTQSSSHKTVVDQQIATIKVESTYDKIDKAPRSIKEDPSTETRLDQVPTRSTEELKSREDDGADKKNEESNKDGLNEEKKEITPKSTCEINKDYEMRSEVSSPNVDNKGDSSKMQCTIDLVSTAKTEFATDSDRVQETTDVVTSPRQVPGDNVDDTNVLGSEFDNKVDVDQRVPTVAVEIDRTKHDCFAEENSEELAATDDKFEDKQDIQDTVMSEDGIKAYNREVFLSQLQENDDKWEKIRSEMLIRHKNEAESLHAVQKLEWEWKAKEIGALDVRTTPVIDETLVPKLNIFLQDY